ncbi:MAG: hydantoinase/oxoprolinase family protein [Proteobacteria bacterium]|nr:hydantoinase/oxoprolinase family protein [Pseudomonadota bacterium]
MSASSATTRPGGRLAVDIGGTFTDVALEFGGRRYTTKVLTTSAAPEKGVMEGVRAILHKSGRSPKDIAIIIHGTTLATNAVIERKGARTALITTEGFRDVIALGTESRFEQYDINLDLPEPLVPRYLRLPVPERIAADGEVLKPLDEKAVRALVPKLVREGVESVAVGFLHSFVNPVHEERVATILAEELAGVPVTLSSLVSPEMREYERFSTACANAFVQPLMTSYLRHLDAALTEAGFTCPLYMMLSGGGVATLETVAKFPIRLVESGPAGGAIFGARIAAEVGLDEVISFDMGGTTAKICLIDDGKPQTARSFEVARVYRFKKGSGLPLRIPVIEMVEIGAGGGSIANLDTMGRIAVGPESAGAEPGPASYDRGGTVPTVTDANLVLGRFDPEHFAGGYMKLNTAKARAAIDQVIGGPLKMTTEMSSLGIVEMVDENMANAARVHAIESGKDFSSRTLVAFGGGGPVHACRVAEKLGITRAIIPTSAGVGSAIGFLRAPVAYEVIRSLYQRFSGFDYKAVNAMLAEMQAEAREIVRRGAGEVEMVEKRIAFMRYVGQGHEIAVELPVRGLEPGDVKAVLQQAYDAEYRRLYNRLIPGSDVEVMSWSLQVSTLPDTVSPAPAPKRTYEPKPVAHWKVFDTVKGEFQKVAIYERTRLEPGARVKGPAIITEDETSTVVGTAFEATVDTLGYIELVAKGG